MNRRHILLSAVGVTTSALLPNMAWAQRASDPLATHLDALVAAEQFLGYSAVVWHDGETTAAHGGAISIDGPAVTSDSLFRIASITKLITTATALTLVEDGLIELDNPVDAVLPELSGLKVLSDIAGPVDDVEDTVRPVTLRHLLTNTFGQGLIMQWPPSYPIQQAMSEAGIEAGTTFFHGSYDEYMAAVSRVPLAAQPGEGFFYNNGFELAGILIARLTGKSLSETMDERIFEPLGMSSTMFRVPTSERDRVTTLYMPDMQTGEVAPLADSSLSLDETIPLESAAGGLASTAQDLLLFGRMLLGRGELEGARVLSEASVVEMFTDQLTAEQRASPHAAGVLGGGLTWGLGGSVSLGGGEMNLPKGAFGWNGGYGTTLYVDPANNLVGVLLTNQVVMSATPAEPLIGFWKIAYEISGVAQE